MSEFGVPLAEVSKYLKGNFRSSEAIHKPQLTDEQRIEKYRQLRNNERLADVPTASVVIPVYSGETSETVMKLVDSLLENKNAPPTEIITVVNGKESESDLKQTPIAQHLEKLGFKVAYAHNPPERRTTENIFNARQVGMDASEGKYYLGVDADCRVGEGWISAMCKQLEATDFAYGPVLNEKTSDLHAERVVRGLSVVAKAVKLWKGFVPMQGANHAFDREKMIAVCADPYRMIKNNEQEMTWRLPNMTVGFVDEAGIITPFGYAEKADSSWNLIRKFVSHAVKRNLKMIQARKLEQSRQPA